MPKSTTMVQSTCVLLLMIIVYIMVFVTTLTIHQKHKRYSQHHFYTRSRDDVETRKNEMSKDRDEGNLHTSVTIDLPDGQKEVRGTLLIENQIDLAGGQQVTDVLQNKILFDEQHQRLRFVPGTLSLTPAETLSHCYADPEIYKHHFPKRRIRSIPISLKHKLVFIMIAKSGSSTGRWVMNNVLDAEELKVHKDLSELSPGGKYEDFSVIAFARDPLTRFYSSYDEVFYRYGPWMRESEENGRYGPWADHVRDTDHPHQYIYENITTFQEFQDAFCPPEIIPEEHKLKRPAAPRRPNWCSNEPTRENGTLAATFERFVFEYDGVSPWDVHLHLQVPMLSNHETGRPARVGEIFSTEMSTKHWEDIVSRYGETLPEDDESLNGRALPRRFNPKLVSIEAKRRICHFAAIDYCCLNFKLPVECNDEGVDVSCALDKDERGDYRIQPWSHPNEVSRIMSKVRTSSGNEKK